MRMAYLACALLLSCCTGQGSARCEEGLDQFRFWEGSWTVTGADGTPNGTSVIARSESECAILETIVMPSGNEGRGRYVYEPGADRWAGRLSSRAVTIEVRGRVEDNGARMEGVITYQDGTTRGVRYFWAAKPDGRVTQDIFHQRSENGAWSHVMRKTYSPS